MISKDIQEERRKQIKEAEESFLFMADAHITRRTWVNSTVLSGDAYKCLEQLGGPGLPETLVIGGDWFDTNRPSSDDVVKTMEFLDHFRTVYYIRGNHDNVVPSYLEADMERTGHLTVALDDAYGNIDGRTLYNASDARFTPMNVLYGISHTDDTAFLKKQLESVAERIRKRPTPEGIVVLHAAFRHLIPLDGVWQLDGNEVSEIFKGCKVTLLVGHVHKRDTRMFGDNVLFHSPGSLYPRSSDAMLEEHFVTRVSFDGSIAGKTQTDCRRYFEVPWSSQKDLDEAAAGAVDDNPDGWLQPYMLVKLPPKSEAHPAFPDGVSMQVTFRKTAEKNVGTVMAPRKASTLEDAVGAECDDEDMRQLALTLARSDDPVKEIDEWLEAWKVEKIE